MFRDDSPDLPIAEKNPQSVAAENAHALKNLRSKPKVSQALLAANRQHQVEAALADDVGSAQHSRPRLPPARGPPSLPVRLLTKPEILLIAGGVSYPTLWSWMRAGMFPRSRIVGGKSMWRSDEVQAWLDALPLRPLKGDSSLDQSDNLNNKTTG
jgi:predicted DNA-binding transcriptional regulator AlpA